MAKKPPPKPKTKASPKKSNPNSSSSSPFIDRLPIILVIVLVVILIVSTIAAAALGFTFAAIRASNYPQSSQLFTHQLTGVSTSTVNIWTTVPSRHIFPFTEVPEGYDTQIKVFCAGNEYEPFTIIIHPTMSSQSWEIDIDWTTGLPSSGIEIEISRVGTVRLSDASDNMNECESLPCDYPDVIWPVQAGTETVVFPRDENTVLWFTVRVLPDSGLGGQDFEFNVNVGPFTVPVRLHVFDFDIPQQLSIKSQMNFGFQNVLARYGVGGTGDEYWKYVNMIKGFFLGHRLTPKSALWPGGLTSSGGSCFIDYDCGTRTISDPHGIWGFDLLAQQALIDGNDMLEGTTSVFPDSMFMTFQNNDASQDQRPSSYCSLSRSAGDWMGSESTAYNTMWGNYMHDLQEYLRSFNLLEQTHYYAWNEPQDQADHDAVAWYSQFLKHAAPDIKLMCSEEARPEIYDNPSYPDAKVDIWLPVLDNFDPEIAFARKAHCDEATWVYFLHGTVPPWLNILSLDHPGIENRLMGYFMWKYRVEGLAYYSMNYWSDNPFSTPMSQGQNGNRWMVYPPTDDGSNLQYGENGHRMVPSMRIELLRDSLEDFEYLRLLNNGDMPTPQNQGTEADRLSHKLIMGLKSYMRDDEFLYNLRRLIGLTVGGEAGWGAVPDLEPSPPHVRCEGDPGSYYINFQDPSGQPTASPLVVDSHTWEKVGWVPFSEAAGSGWYGELDWVEYSYVSGAPNVLQSSIIYCDYGRPKTFIYYVPNGEYDVTVSVGWEGRTGYSRQKVYVNSVPFVDDENSNGGYLVRTHTICVTDYRISMDMGIWDEYTMINYLSIETTGSGCTAPDYVPVEYIQPTDASCSV